MAKAKRAAKVKQVGEILDGVLPNPVLPGEPEEPKRGKTPELSGMVGEGVERQKDIPEIDDAANGYVAIRDKRIKLTEQEGEAKAQLLALMQSHGLVDYRYTDGDEEPRLVSVINPDITVKVKKLTDSVDVE